LSIAEVVIACRKSRFKYAPHIVFLYFPYSNLIKFHVLVKLMVLHVSYPKKTSAFIWSMNQLSLSQIVGPSIYIKYDLSWNSEFSYW
jgi:hypothetical protein